MPPALLGELVQPRNSTRCGASFHGAAAMCGGGPRLPGCQGTCLSGATRLTFLPAAQVPEPLRAGSVGLRREQAGQGRVHTPLASRERPAPTRDHTATG